MGLYLSDSKGKKVNSLHGLYLINNKGEVNEVTCIKPLWVVFMVNKGDKSINGKIPIFCHEDLETAWEFTINKDKQLKEDKADMVETLIKEILVVS